MSQPLSEYFAQEAGEFLDRLDALLASSDAPDPVEFFRLARGVRGSAQIAGAGGVAAVAERLEDGARSLRDGVLPWSEEVRRRARETVDDLRVLVAGQGRWGAAEEARARDAAARWEGVGTGRRGVEVPRAGDQLYEFLRREIAGVVEEMGRALSALEADPAAREPLRAVLRRMRPVRGVAGMDSLAPVLELLEGIEDAAHEVLARPRAEGRQLEVLAAGRDALRSAGDELERGEGVGESSELMRFRELRDAAEGEADAAEAGVVPVSRLFFDDAGPHVVSSPLAPVAEAAGASLAPEVEGFLRMEATGFLDRAEGLIAGLSQRPARFGRIARQLAELAAGVGELAVTYGMTMLSAAADQAAESLGRAGSAEEARTALRRLRSTLPGAAPLTETAVEVEPEEDAAPAPSVASVAGEDGVVPVEALLYAPGEALREALAMRPRVEAAAGGAAGRGTPLGEALDELFALVELGLGTRA
ncbi:MAG TPA: Hpt domain-containing protein [Longimicrobium sp.]|jgi:chemotaxis protein histidine kinase CheA